MSNEDYLVKAKKPITFLGDARDMNKLEQLVKRLKKKDKGVSVSGCIRLYIKQGIAQSLKEMEK
jgi:hypothetical protein